jgi:hypothetical protein
MKEIWVKNGSCTKKITLKAQLHNKGKLKWKQIQKDEYALKAELGNKDEIIDDEKLFHMGKHSFDFMLNKVRIGTLTKTRNEKYRHRDFRVFFETEKRLVIPYEVIKYLLSIGFDLYIDWEIMNLYMIDERGKRTVFTESDMRSFRCYAEEMFSTLVSC